MNELALVALGFIGFNLILVTAAYDSQYRPHLIQAVTSAAAWFNRWIPSRKRRYNYQPRHAV